MISHSSFSEKILALIQSPSLSLSPVRSVGLLNSNFGWLLFRKSQIEEQKNEKNQSKGRLFAASYILF